MVDIFNKGNFKRWGTALGIDSLTTRERWVLSCGVAFALCLAVFQLAVVPFFEARSNLAHAIESKKHDLVKIRELQQEYRLLKNLK